MKILRLNFQNLASLAGNWSIDFTDPILSRNGIFAIIGETASGKTTIFDAVCLALYGQTPRLTSAFSETNNEIMTIGAKDCFAEVVFEIQSKNGPKYYKSRWNQTRTKRKGSKNPFAKSEHKISELTGPNDNTGHEISDKKENSKTKSEQLTGLSFKQFTQAAMLSQGEFTKFLAAESKERANLLEKITGTGIYKVIAQKAYDHYRNANKALENLSSRNEELLSLAASGKSEEELQNALIDVDKDIKAIAKQEEEQQQKLDWRKRIDTLETNRVSLLEEQEQLKQEQSNFTEDASRLERALKAKDISEDWTELKFNRKNSSDSSANIQKQEKQLEEMRKDIAEAKKAAEKSNKELEELKLQTKAELKKIDYEIVPLDNDIAVCESNTKTAQDEFLKAKKTLNDDLKFHHTITEELYNIQGKLSTAEAYFNEHAIDAEINERISGFTENCKSIEEKIAEKDAKTQELNNLQNSIAEDKKTSSDTSEKLSELEKQLLVIDKDIKANKISLQEEQSKFGGADIDRARLLMSWRDKLRDNQDALAACGKWQELSKKLQENLKACQQAEETAKSLDEQINIQSNLCKSLDDAKKAKAKALENLNKLDALIDDLQDGQACPLCGSEHHPHPYKKSAEATELSQEIKEMEVTISEAGKKLENLNQSLIKANADAEKFRNIAQDAKNNLKTPQDELSSWESKLSLPAICADNAVLWTSRLNETEIKCQTAFNELNEAETKIKELEKAADLLSKQQTQKDSEKADLRTKLSEAEATIKAKLQQQEKDKENLTELQNSIISKWQELKDAFIVFGCSLPDTPNASILADKIADLQNRSKNYQDKKTEHDDLKMQHERKSTELESLMQKGKEAKTTFETRKTAYEQIANQLNKMREKRQALYGDKNTKDEKDRLQAVLDSKTKDNYNKAQEVIMLESSCKTLGETINDAQEKLQKLNVCVQEMEAKFKQSLAQLGFTDENHYIACLIEPDEITILQNKQKDLEAKESSLLGRINENISALDAEKHKPLTDKTSAELNAEMQSIRAEKDSQNTKKGQIEADLKKIKDIFAQSNDLKEQIKDASKKLEHWKTMTNYLGTADGNTFNQFAQGITFEILLQSANRHLHHFDDRYTLQSKGTETIDFTIVDSMQGNALRTPSNLSGGEKFLVSLSLALGLSELASEKTSIDTLFIDEGFGTLSEDYLNTVLNALTTLKNDNKTIGVISHVEQLKNVITQHISLRKLGGGLSEIITSGPEASPGCRKLS
ncbi:MAG: AAA family ATPase [bacterium]|nr:AAA family ATPase [bacterium]